MSHTHTRILPDANGKPVSVDYGPCISPVFPTAEELGSFKPVLNGPPGATPTNMFVRRRDGQDYMVYMNGPNREYYVDEFSYDALTGYCD